MIRDGATNTFMIGEKYLNSDHYYDSLDGADYEPMFCGTDDDRFRSTWYAHQSDKYGTTPSDWSDETPSTDPNSPKIFPRQDADSNYPDPILSSFGRRTPPA